MKTELLISEPTTGKAFIPAVLDGAEWITERHGTPGKLTFKVVRDDILRISEGAAVRFSVNGKVVFFGFVFTQKREKEDTVSVTAYDQLRYLKNKNTYVYENKTASQVVRMIAEDFQLNTGVIENTGYVIPSRVEENTSLFDIIENALDLTLTNSKNMFVLYDDGGKLTLKGLQSMYVGTDGKYLVIDEETGENFEYSSSIDSDTYNRIKLTYANEKTGKYDVYIARNGAHINEWGVLQYCDTLREGENGQAKAEALLRLYDKKSRSLKIKDAVGDTRVRGGSMVVVCLDLGGVNVKNFMLVEKAVHKFSNEEHFMDLTLRGGEIG